MTTAQKIVWTAVGTWVAIVPALLLAHAAGPDPRYTGAPGDAPLACASQTCHTSAAKGGPINAAGGSVSAVFSADHYVPGQALTITVAVADPVNVVYGFQMTARYGSTDPQLSANQAGTFTPGGSDTFVMCDNFSPRLPGKSCSASQPVEFIEHSAPSRKSFTFTWTAPATDVGPVHFYVAGNAVNNNATADGGDHVYTASYVLSSGTSVACSSAKPSISQGGIISAFGFGALKSFAAGSWLEIYGANFATTTRLWGGSDFNGAIAPTMIDNVSVSVNGKPAAVDFVSPGQVNVQAPADSMTGPVNVTVTNCTQTSDAIQVTKSDLVPGLLINTVGDKVYLGALVPNSSTFTGYPSHPAKSGDIIQVYGIGFGDTTPSIAPGTIAGVANALVNPLTVLFGTAPGPTPLYQGLAPGFVGLYQFNLTVPTLADGDYPMSFQVGSVKAAQSLLFTVKN
jgi:uncharacterized protein (TIGR03437 family)